MLNCEVKIYELTPNDSHKSFYGKARVLEYEDGRKALISYETIVIVMFPDGAVYRTWNGWSATTGRHIRAFCGLNKREYLALPYHEMR